MPQSPQQGKLSLIVRAWVVFAALLTLLGGAAAFYNPLVGAVLFLMALVGARRAWCNLSPAPELSYRLIPDPNPGALGGDIGGCFESRDSSGPSPSQPMVTLACVRLCERRRSQSVEHRREAVWRERRPVLIEAGDDALRFRFSPPDHLPVTEARPELVAGQWRCHHYWTLTLEGTVSGRSAVQGFRIRVARSAQRMQKPLQNEEARNNEPVATEVDSAPDRLRRRLSLENDGAGVRFYDGPRASAWSRCAAAVAGIAMAVCGAQIPGFAGWSGVIVGLGLALQWLYRRVRGLRFELNGRVVAVTNEWWGWPLFIRRGTLANAGQLELRPTPASVCTDLVLVDQGKRILLARDLPPGEAETLRDALVQRILPG